MRFHIDSKFEKEDTVYSGRILGNVGTIKDIEFKHFGNTFQFHYLVESNNGTRVWLEEKYLQTKGW